MKQTMAIVVVGLGALVSQYASAATIRTDFLGGRFNSGSGDTTGYVDAVNPSQDNTGAQIGTQIQFQRGLGSGPGAIQLTLDSPTLGDLVMDFTQLVSFNLLPVGEFYTMGNGSGGFISVNLPYFSVASFGFTGLADYTPYAPPPVVIDPPPTGCVVDCGGSPPVVVGAPEPSTWVMMALGFVALGWSARGRKGRPLATPAC